MRFCVLLSLLFLGQAIWITVDGKTPSGIDFYHFWLPAQACTAQPDDAELGSPYVESAAYAAVLNARADRLWRQFGVPAETVTRTHRGLAAQPPRDNTAALMQRVRQRLNPRGQELLVDEQRFLLANLRRREIDLTATPLLYSFFFFLPADYDHATALYATLQFLCFLAGTMLLWCAAGGRWSEGALLALTLMMVFLPYRSDLRVGNLNCLHLLLAAVPLAVACGPLRRATAASAPDDSSGDDMPRKAVQWGALTLALLAFYVLLKPSFVLLGAAVGAHVAWRLGLRRFTLAAIPAAVASGLLLAWPCLYFGSFSVWSDWLAYVAADDGAHLAYEVQKFNTSLTLHLAGWLGGSTFLHGALIAGALLISFLLVGIGPARRATAGGQGYFRTALATMLEDPLVAASFGIVVTLATSPLVWGHYTMVILVALAWTLQPTLGLRAHFWLVALATMLYARAYMMGLQAFSAELPREAVRVLVGVAWLPLWLGMLLVLRRRAPAGLPAERPAASLPTSPA